MRRASFAVLAVILFFACISAFAQNTTPQWKVVKAIKLTNQSLEVPLTTLFTPTAVGAYRLTGYLAGYGPAQDLNWELLIHWNDSTGAYETAEVLVSLGSGSTFLPLYPIPFSPEVGKPVQFQVSASNPTQSATYTLWFTIEHLE